MNKEVTVILTKFSDVENILQINEKEHLPFLLEVRAFVKRFFLNFFCPNKQDIGP